MWLRVSIRRDNLRPLAHISSGPWLSTTTAIPLQCRLRHDAPFHTLSALHRERGHSRDPQTGFATPVPESSSQPARPQSPFYFITGYAGWPKRPSRPFPPPFFSPPSGSFSDPLSTHNRSRDRRMRAEVNGEMILGVTNGDDAMEASERFVAVNDGVGAWAKKERGHAPLWSRLVVHFWAKSAEEDGYGEVSGSDEPKPVQYLSEAYAKTQEALSGEGEGQGWLGTTTACSALLHSSKEGRPVVYVTQLGDCKVLILRPSDVTENGTAEDAVLFSSKEQYHYFDCPRQLGTNSPDSPEENAKLDVVSVEEDDLILAMSDGVTDNIWEHEIVAFALDSLKKWQGEQAVKHLAENLVLEARKIAEDPFAESPFMEKAVDEGLAIDGGKLDDISVVAGLVKRRKSGEKG